MGHRNKTYEKTEQSADTKGIIRSCTLKKGRQYYGQKKKDKKQ